jgi:BirA family biotin operon repressor/biotin-[acetyl-CoA-carboxylase] ligase
METLFIGTNVIFLSETESTNSYAIELLKNVKVINGTVVHTYNQTKGRGQRGNTWMSENARNLTFSVILTNDILGSFNQFYLSKIAALACYDLMAHYLNSSQFDIKIKWPNDILVNAQKIGGILIENVFNGQKLQYSVIGIGLNINQLNFDGIANATSIAKLSSEINIDEALKVFYRYLEKYALFLKQQKLDVINELYFASLYGYKSILPFKLNQQVINFFLDGVNTDGKLKLLDEKKQICLFDNKEIEFIL